MFKCQQELNTHGFNPGELILDGKIHRFDRNGHTDKSAWYIGFINRSPYTGEEVETIVFADWRTGERHEWSSLSKMSPEDRVLYTRNIREATKAAEEDRKDTADATALLAKDTWDRCTDSGSSPYLERKKITKLYGARTEMASEHRNIIVPMINQKGELRGLQRIFPDGKKLFLKGQNTSQLFHKILGNDSKIFIAEGFATGISVHKATNNTVYIAFQAHNLSAIANIVRRFHPGIEIILAGDDDVDNVNNIGREMAVEAAKKVNGNAIFPIFKNRKSKEKDFNDLEIAEGIDSLVNQLLPICIPGANNKVTVLGRDNNHYFLISSYNRMLTVLPRGCMTSPAHLLSLAPIDFWRNCYGENKQGNPDWQTAASVLMRQGNESGIFSPLKVRGRGVWLDKGRIIVHRGDDLLIDGVPHDLMDIESKYVYEQDQHVEFSIENPMTSSEAINVVHACNKLPWRNLEHSILAAGWIALCRISGALSWRPHLWITGEAGSGKTTFRDMILKPAAGNLGLHPASTSTESGIRQSSRSASLTILFDEAEARGKHKTDLISAVLDLARMASSENNDTVLKGTPGGSALIFRSRGMYAMFSIRVALEDAADVSRFTVMELVRGCPKQFRELKILMNCMTQDYWDRLAARSVRLLPKIIADYEKFHEAFSHGHSARFGQQYGMLMAGYYSLVTDSPLTTHEIENIVSGMSLHEEKERIDDFQPINVLDILLDYRVNIEIEIGLTSRRLEHSIFELISARMQKELLSFGLDLDDDFLYIRTGEGGIAHAAYSQSEGWTSGWINQLLRIDGAKKIQRRFGSRHLVYRCISIPRSVIIHKP